MAGLVDYRDPPLRARTGMRQIHPMITFAGDAAGVSYPRHSLGLLIGRRLALSENF